MLTQDEILLDHVPSDSSFATGETIAATEKERPLLFWL
jgi:hypothetical protein